MEKKEKGKDNFNILIVDDDLEITDLLKKYLEREGYKISVAYDGEDALVKLQNSKPDIIILDLLMPKVDGFSFCQILKNIPTFKDIPIIAISSNNSSEYKTTAYKMGVDRFIAKPIHIRELKAQIRSILRRLYEYNGKHKVKVNIPSSSKVQSKNGEKFPEVKGLSPIEKEEFNKGLEYFKKGEFFKAWKKWVILEKKYVNNTLLKQYVSMARMNIYRKIRSYIKDFDRKLMRNQSPEVKSIKVSSEELFVLSLIDPNLTIKKLIKLSGMEELKFLEILISLIEKKLCYPI